MVGGVLLLALAGTLGAVFGGPSLGEHEALVAQCARNMRLTGDWIVPEFLGTPYFRKPPLPYWQVAAASYLLGDDPQTHLPVSKTAARLPSGIAAFITVLLLWRLGVAMFGRRVGIVTAVVASSSLLIVLYGPNATAEMPLMLCCTWSYVHFWFAATTRRPWARFVHAMLFYVAMGVAMLAKGPAPIALVAMPLAVWWYAGRPLRLIARCGLGAWREAIVLFLRQAWPRTLQVFTRLWCVPGLLVFAAIFVPWMWQVASRHPHAWDLWNWQYWQRIQGNYEDTRERGFFYYIPVVVGLVVPWVFLVFEAVAAPWMRRYARQRRALLYAGLWALVGVLVMSAMSFKKPYYIAPAVPGLLLLIAVVADRFYASPSSATPFWESVGFGGRRRSVRAPGGRRVAWTLWAIGVAVSVVALIICGVWLRQNMATVRVRASVIAAAALALLLTSGTAYIRGRGWMALGITAATTIAAFDAVWHSCGPAIDHLGSRDKIIALGHALNDAGIPQDAKVLWASKPDPRLGYHFNRRTGYVVPPGEIVTQMVDRIHHKRQLMDLVAHRADELLASPEPVYLILDRKYYEAYKPFMSSPGYVVASAGEVAGSPEKGVVVVSNVAKPPG